MKHLLIAFALLATPASALTVIPECSEVDETIEAAVNAAMNTNASYVMAVGKFRGAEELEATRGYDAGTFRVIKSQFTGRAANGNAFANPLSVSVTLDQACLNNACLPRTDGTPYLVFLRKKGGTYSMSFSEFNCTAPVFERPSKAMQDQALQCLRNGGC